MREENKFELLNLLQLNSITIPFSFPLYILKRAPSSVQAFGNPGFLWNSLAV